MTPEQKRVLDALPLEELTGYINARQSQWHVANIDGSYACPFAFIPGEAPCDSHIYSGCTWVTPPKG